MSVEVLLQSNKSMFIFTSQKNKQFSTLIRVLLCVVCIASMFSFSAHAATNPQINYQGKLTDNTGATVADGSYNMVFKLYTQPSGGSAIWTETLSGGSAVPVTSGLFSVMLGSTTSLTSVNFNQTLYLGVNIAADGEMSPRKIIGTVPAAFEARKLGGVASSSFVRSDEADTIAASTASTLLTITQNGVGDILNLFDGATKVFAVLDGGLVGVGTSTPSQELTVAGDLRLTGRIYDSLNSPGTNGFILKSTGTGQQWVATSTLGFSSSFSNSAQLAALLSDETGTAGSAVFSVSPSFTGTLNAAAATLSSTLTLSGSAANIALGSNYLSGDGGDEGIFVSSTGNVGIGTTSPTAELYITSANPSFIVDDSDALGSQIEFVASGANTYIRSGVNSSDVNAVFRVVRTGTTNANVKNFDVYATTTYLTGSLGIGTTSPLSKLHLHNSSGDSIVTLTGSDSGNRGINFNLHAGTPAWSFLMDTNEDMVLREHRSGVDNFRIQNTAGTDLFFLETGTGKFAFGTSTTNAVLRIDDTANTTGGLFVSSSNSTPGAAVNLATFQTTNASWDRPLVRVIDSSTSGAAANLRLDSPNPDIEFVETDQTAPSGKFEIAGSGNRFQINSRRADETAFENIMEFAQRAQTSVDAVTINLDSTSATRNAIKIINNVGSTGAQPGIAWRNASSAVDTARISSLSGSGGVASKLLFEVADSSKVLQTRMVVDVAGNVGIGTSTPSRALTVAGSARLTGALYDTNNSAGTLGMVLQ
ncbi:MAG: hypothetical protein RLZZ76_500, partial [Candidatus Parcubacteria bacterium]